jgi:hypothetical protein
METPSNRKTCLLYKRKPSKSAVYHLLLSMKSGSIHLLLIKKAMVDRNMEL